MVKVVKNGVKMAARDKNQLAAFLNNGWAVDKENQIEETPTIPRQTEEKKTYTKTEINRMSTAELQALALENDIDGANDMTGAELKKVLIDKFNL